MYLGCDNGIFLEYRAIAKMQKHTHNKQLERISSINFIHPFHKSHRYNSRIAKISNIVLSHDRWREIKMSHNNVILLPQHQDISKTRSINCSTMNLSESLRLRMTYTTETIWRISRSTTSRSIRQGRSAQWVNSYNKPVVQYECEHLKLSNGRERKPANSRNRCKIEV